MQLAGSSVQFVRCCYICCHLFFVLVFPCSRPSILWQARIALNLLSKFQTIFYGCISKKQKKSWIFRHCVLSFVTSSCTVLCGSRTYLKTAFKLRFKSSIIITFPLFLFCLHVQSIQHTSSCEWYPVVPSMNGHTVYSITTMLCNIFYGCFFTLMYWSRLVFIT